MSTYTLDDEINVVTGEGPSSMHSFSVIGPRGEDLMIDVLAVSLFPPPHRGAGRYFVVMAPMGDRVYWDDRDDTAEEAARRYLQEIAAT